MASIQPRGGKFQLRVKHKLLPKPFFWTFDNEDQARAYGEQLESLLARGVVPLELLAPAGEDKKDKTLLTNLIPDYVKNAAVSPSDVGLLETVKKGVVGVCVFHVDYRWVESYVRDLKTKSNLAPGSIRKRVGVLARVLDWHHRNTTGRDQVNPFRLLPVGYSSYTAADAEKVEPKYDVHRDRRMTEDEAAAVALALSGGKVKGRERALVPDAAFSLLYRLLSDTGLRLSEAFRLRVDQLGGGMLRVEGSKGHRSAKKPRMVPLKPATRKELEAWCEGRAGQVFPFWDGTAAGVRKTTSRLSVRFGTLFDFAGVQDMTTHDLRHEAACRWFELRNGEGHWALSDIEITRVMGWTSLDMALRYASIRGSDLVARL